MTTEPSTPVGTTSELSPQPPQPPPLQQPPASSTSSGKWKLPAGIEDHIEDGVIKIATGVLIGGTLGMLLFKSGKGWRSASIASGVGVAMGSTYVRCMSSVTNNTVNTANDTTSTNTTQQPIITPGVRLQPFDTKSSLPTTMNTTNPPKGP